MDTNETVKCDGSNSLTSTIQFWCVSILETLVHMTQKRQANISVDLSARLCSILASVSFWPLLIVESVLSQHMLFTHDLLVKQDKLKCELDCFNWKTVVFLRVFTSNKRKQLQSTFLRKKNRIVYGDYLGDVLFIVRAGSDIIKADFMHIKRTTFPTKMKTGILLEELK